MNWYMVVYDDDSENDYAQYRNDEEAISELLDLALWSDKLVLEIYRCNDDETLSPTELIYH